MHYIEDEDGWGRYAFSPGERPNKARREELLLQRRHRSGWILHREHDGDLWVMGSGGPHRSLGPITLAEGKRQVRAEALAEWGIKHPEDAREDLAALEHDQWAHWTEYMLEVLRLAIDAGLSIPRAGERLLSEGDPLGRAMRPEWRAIEDALARWKRQIETPYADLSEKEKDSDREWADKVAKALEVSRG